jgi:glycine/D-amino acid oxidase-like deaminating enzyme/nitrite reductase/ring-hydroxylating ferredoxin subunit
MNSNEELGLDLPGVDDHADVIVVGAGITGLSTALMLLDSGRRVIVLEQDVPGALASGRNTGKASLLQGSRLSTIRRNHPARLVRAYVDGNRAGQQWLRRTCERAGVQLREATAYSYAQSADGLDAVDAEVRAAREAGLAARRVDRVDDAVPFPIAGAAALDGQYALDPAELMRGLADQVVERGGSLVSGVRALGVRASDPVQVRTSAGVLTAGQVLIATGAPILGRGLYWAKTSGSRSLLLSFAPPPGPAELPDGLYLSVDSPGRSIRSAVWGGEARLIVGGGGHPVGREESSQRLVDEIADWTRTWWPGVGEPDHWAAQDYESHNRVPFVGRMPRGRGRVWFATGYAKWGLTNGTSAAIRIAHEMLGARRPDWANVIGSRFSMPVDFARGVSENARVGAAAARGWAGALLGPDLGQADAARPAGPVDASVSSSPSSQPRPSSPSARAVRPLPREGQGVVGRQGLRPVAVSTVGGETCAVSAVCTHLGGVLNWNDAELTWDCPLHASRFDHRGRRIEGPALHDLERLPGLETGAVAPPETGGVAVHG